MKRSFEYKSQSGRSLKVTYTGPQKRVAARARKTARAVAPASSGLC